MAALRRHRLPTAPLWMLLLLAALAAVRWQADRGDPLDRVPVGNDSVLVLRAVDGDTLMLADGQRVRLIGVDTPESKHPDRPPEPFGAEAAAFTQQRVAGRSVTLEYDRERIDPYRRILAYVTIDGELLNETLIREGLGRAVTSFPYRSDLQRRFRQAEESAQAAGRGIWSVPQEASASP